MVKKTSLWSGRCSPGHAAVVTDPTVLLLVVAAAGLARVHVTVQTLTFAVDQELKWLQAADAERIRRALLRTQQLPFGPFFLDSGLQLAGRQVTGEQALRGGCYRGPPPPVSKCNLIIIFFFMLSFVLYLTAQPSERTVCSSDFM